MLKTANRVESPVPVPVLFVHFGAEGIRGSERCLLDLLRHIDKHRFTPFVWCNAGEMGEAVRELGIPIHISRFTILFNWAPPRFELLHFVTLIREGLRLIHRLGIRLVHTNSGAPNQWMVPVARTAEIPLITHLHSSYVLRDRCTLGLHHVALAVGVSKTVVQGLLEDGLTPDRARVIYNGVDLSRLSIGDATSLRSSLGICAEEVTITSVGALIEIKGFDILIRAFHLLRQNSIPARLLIVGEGPVRPSLEALVIELDLARCVHFLGKRHDVGAIFRDATDIAASAARYEALPLNALEAGAFQLPFVGTQVGGVPEAVKDGATGILVPPEDPVALANALIFLCGNRDLRRRYGAAAHAFVLETFNIDRNVSAFEQVYDEFIARPRNYYGWRASWGPMKPWARLVGGWIRRRLPGKCSS